MLGIIYQEGRSTCAFLTAKRAIDSWMQNGKVQEGEILYHDHAPKEIPVKKEGYGDSDLEEEMLRQDSPTLCRFGRKIFRKRHIDHDFTDVNNIQAYFDTFPFKNKFVEPYKGRSAEKNLDKIKKALYKKEIVPYSTSFYQTKSPIVDPIKGTISHAAHALLIHGYDEKDLPKKYKGRIYYIDSNFSEPQIGYISKQDNCVYKPVNPSDPITRYTYQFPLGDQVVPKFNLPSSLESDNVTSSPKSPNSRVYIANFS